MKRGLSVAAGMAALTAAGLLAGCGEGGKAAEKGAPPPVATSAESPAPAAPAPTATGPASPAASGAPSFAVIYPGGELEAPATLAQSPTGPGGIVTFTTDADPDAVIAFYKSRAEAAGLKSINAMKQGEASAYAAGDGVDGTGKLLSVVASPLDSGPTSVQLSWSAGR